MLNLLDFEEKKASKVKLLTRIYSNFVLKYPIIPIILSFLLSFLFVILSCYFYGMWPTCNQNYNHWSRDEISEKWNSYLASKQTTYASLHKLMTSSFSIPYQFDLTQAGAIFYQRKNAKPYKNSISERNEIDDSENVLTVESLRAIWETEEKMHQIADWTDYCYKIPKDMLATFIQPFLYELLDYMKDHLSELEEDTNCLAFKSIITEFKKYMRDKLKIENPKSTDLTKEIIYNYINGRDELNRSIEKRLKVTYFGTDYENMKTTRIRTLVLSGLPLKGYDSKSDRFEEQRKKLGKWQVKFLKPLYDQINNESSPLYPCAAFPFEIEYEIFDIVTQHFPYFGGIVFILVVVVCIFFKSIFLGIFSTFGTLLSILLSVSIINFIFQIHYFDVETFIAFLMNCLLFNLCNMYIFQIYKNNNSFLYLVEKTTKTMLVALFFNSFTFLPVLYFGSKVGQHFGFYCFILTIVYFVLIFTWFLPLLSLYSKMKTHKFRTESLYSLNTILLASVDEESTNVTTFTENNSNSVMKRSTSSTPINNNQKMSGYTNSKSTSDLSKTNDSETNSDSNSQAINTSSNTSTQIFSYNESINDYPHQKLFDFLKVKVTFDINCCNQFPTNIIEKFICYRFWPFVYFYRFIFILVAIILLCTNIYFTTQVDTKNEFHFLKRNHRIQRALDLATDGFLNPLNDNAFVYVWGLNKKAYKSYKSWTIIDDPGYHKSFNKDEVNVDLITNPKVQSHIMETWNMLLNMTDIIDSFQSEYFGINPWEVWDMIANTDLGPFNFIFKFLNFTEPPKNITHITSEQYHSYLLVWQLLLSLKTMQEADNYIPGTLISNTVGFSFKDYSLQYIAIKANMFLTKHKNRKELKAQYNRAKEIEKMIQDEAVRKGIPEFKGWMTSAAWQPLAVEENIINGVIIIFVSSSILSCIAPIFFVSYKMSIIVFIDSFVALFFTVGTQKVLFDWEIGLNEALMIAVSNTFFSFFFLVSLFEAFSKSNQKLPKFGKIQIALTYASVPLFVVVFVLLTGIPILYFCPYQLYDPFIIYLFFGAFFCVLWGLILSPIMLYVII